jgi:hypothetical protein
MFIGISVGLVTYVIRQIIDLGKWLINAPLELLDNVADVLAKLHLDINPEEFLMIGNSLKSDVIPVLEIGSEAIHIPYHTTWEHEHVADTTSIQPYMTLDNFHDLLGVFYL